VFQSYGGGFTLADADVYNFKNLDGVISVSGGDNTLRDVKIYNFSIGTGNNSGNNVMNIAGTGRFTFESTGYGIDAEGNPVYTSSITGGYTDASGNYTAKSVNASALRLGGSAEITITALFDNLEGEAYQTYGYAIRSGNTNFTLQDSYFRNVGGGSTAFQNWQGGALYLDASSMVVHINGTTFDDVHMNKNINNAWGGAIYFAGKELYIDNSTFKNCYITTNAAETGFGQGSALYVYYGDVSVTNSTFEGNGRAPNGSYGGSVIWFRNFKSDGSFSQLRFEDNAFIGNWSTSIYGGTYNDNGSNYDVYVRGNLFMNNLSRAIELNRQGNKWPARYVEITDNVFINNRSGNGGSVWLTNNIDHSGTDADGNRIYGYVLLQNNEFYGNTSTGEGGAVYVTNTGTLPADYTGYQGNGATLTIEGDYYGSLYDESDSLVLRPVGAAYQLYDASTGTVYAVFTQNTQGEWTADAATGEYTAFSASVDLPNAKTPTAEVTFIRDADNKVVYAFYTAAMSARIEEGRLIIDESDRTTAQMVRGNLSASVGGALRTAVKGQVLIKDTTFYENQANRIVTSGNSHSLAGAIYTDTSSKLTITGSLFENNFGNMMNSWTDGGQGVTVFGGTLVTTVVTEITDTSFIGNGAHVNRYVNSSNNRSVSVYGGVIYATNELTVRDSEFLDTFIAVDCYNAAGTAHNSYVSEALGIAIEARGKTLTIEDTVFSGNDRVSLGSDKNTALLWGVIDYREDNNNTHTKVAKLRNLTFTENNFDTSMYYKLTADTEFQEGKQYYILSTRGFVEADVTAGGAVSSFTYYELAERQNAI